MGRYLLRRLLTMIPMFFMMTALVFVIQNFLPGGPVQDALSRIQYGGGDGGGRTMNVEDIAKLKHELEVQYGLDKPVAVRYFIWVKKIMVLDFGDSTATRQRAMDTIAERLPISIGFGVPGFFLTYLVCIFLGMWKALKDGTKFDIATSVILFITYSIPALVISVVALLVFCTDRFLPGGAILPLGGARSDGWDTMTFAQQAKDYFLHMVLPVSAYLLGHFTFLTMLMKNSLLDVLSSDFVRTARAKGASERLVVMKHALRNAVLPLMVGIGGFLASFVAGSIVIETVFGLPGIGRLQIEALNSRDYNVLMGVVVIQSLIVMGGQLMSDMAYVLVDPRIDFK